MYVSIACAYTRVYVCTNVCAHLGTYACGYASKNVCRLVVMYLYLCNGSVDACTGPLHDRAIIHEWAWRRKQVSLKSPPRGTRLQTKAATPAASFIAQSFVSQAAQDVEEMEAESAPKGPPFHNHPPVPLWIQPEVSRTHRSPATGHWKKVSTNNAFLALYIAETNTFA